jgi:hypothetical protein
MCAMHEWMGQVAVVSCEGLTVAVYNEGQPGRGFILVVSHVFKASPNTNVRCDFLATRDSQYTGQHYDPLVAPTANAMVPAPAPGTGSESGSAAETTDEAAAAAAAAAGAAAADVYAATTVATEVRQLPTATAGGVNEVNWEAVNKAALEIAKVGNTNSMHVTYARTHERKHALPTHTPAHHTHHTTPCVPCI